MPVAATPVARINGVKVTGATVKAVRSPNAVPVKVAAGVPVEMATDVTTRVSPEVPTATAHTPRRRNGGRGKDRRHCQDDGSGEDERSPAFQIRMG